MNQPVNIREDTGRDRSWLVPCAIAALFLVWGLIIFFLVGDKGPAAWDFGAIEDIPGQSPYSTEQR
jgi:hypothetical protein